MKFMYKLVIPAIGSWVFETRGYAKFIPTEFGYSLEYHELEGEAPDVYVLANIYVKICQVSICDNFLNVTFVPEFSQMRKAANQAAWSIKKDRRYDVFECDDVRVGDLEEASYCFDVFHPNWSQIGFLSNIW